jgi:acetyl esterase
MAKPRARIEAAVALGLARLPDGVLRRVVGPPVRIDGQELHVEVQLALRLLELSGAKPLDRVGDVEAARAQIVEESRVFAGRRVPVGRVEERTVAGRPARLYVPRGEGGGLLLLFHGGGFVVGDLDTHDNTCRFLAAHSGARVLAVDYRRAPEHRFPAAADDAWAAFLDAVERAPDPDRVAVGGDSAGGNLAAGVAQRAAAEGGPGPAFQLLFYPWLDLSSKRGSYRLFGDGFFLTEGELDWYASHYLGGADDALDARCSPLLGDVGAAVAPAHIVTAGFDPLRDEGEEYAERLRAAGVHVTLRREAGLIHGFVNVVGYGRAVGAAMGEAADALRAGLAAT